MNIYKTEDRPVKFLDDAFCNKCGLSCKVHGHFAGLINETVSGGYASPALGDGNSYNFSMCEQCLLDLFLTFKIPVDKTELF